MDVTLLYSSDCPNWRIAEQRLRAALEQSGRGGVKIYLDEVSTIGVARQKHFTGSPTILIDGVDPFVDSSAPAPPALACRVYRSAEGLAGSPTIAQLVDALEAASVR